VSDAISSITVPSDSKYATTAKATERLRRLFFTIAVFFTTAIVAAIAVWSLHNTSYFVHRNNISFRVTHCLQTCTCSVSRGGPGKADAEDQSIHRKFN
jgi:hypothetical protein